MFINLHIKYNFARKKKQLIISLAIGGGGGIKKYIRKSYLFILIYIEIYSQQLNIYWFIGHLRLSK